MRLLVALLALLVPTLARAQSPYDAAPLLESLRPEERARVPGQAHVNADDLPLYALTIDLADDLRTFELDETVWFTNRTGRALSSVVFRVWVNAVAPEPLVELLEGECLDNVSCRTSMPSASAIVVQPVRPIADSGRIRIRLRMRGRLQLIDPSRTTLMGQGLESLSSLSGGHGTGDYGLLAYSDRVASMAAFFPVLARLRAGLWEQADASTMGDLGSDALGHVSARVRVPDGVRVVATGIEDAPRVIGNRTEVFVRAGFVRDFALAASARFSHRDRTVGGVNVRSWFVDGDEASGARALDAAAHSMRIFSQRFGAYPYTELDVVEAPLVGGAGGIEFSGMVTIANMFYRPMSSGPQGGVLGSLLAGGSAQDLEARRESMIEFVTAHEVGHQWWHGIVGSDSREHPFQDECLAQYSAMLYMRERYGAERARRETEQQVTSGYHMMRLMGGADAAVDAPVSSFTNPVGYAGVVYGKGPHLYPALRQLLGDRAFFAALRGYVSDHRFGTAPPRALFDRMARGPRAARVRALEQRWLEETHGDDDLGQPDLGRMLGGAGGASDPQTQAMLQMAQQLLGGQSGQGGGVDPDALRGLMDMLGGGQGGSQVDPQDALRGLLRMLDGAGP